MNKVARFAVWICSKFTRDEIELMIQQLIDILADKNPDVKPKDDFRQKHPHYRNFFVDTNLPLKEPKKSSPALDYKTLLFEYLKKKGKPLKPVSMKNPNNKVPENVHCMTCKAPSKYLYFNDGKKRSQVKCKVCSSLSQINIHYRKKAKYYCPYCNHSLFIWKKRKDCKIYKCDNDNCPSYISNKAKLNIREKILAKIKPSQFKLRYQFREYHYLEKQLNPSAPLKIIPLSSIHNSFNTLCLILTFHISLGISARKSAFILKNVFSLNVSYQTILNYTQTAAYYCHKFNHSYKGNVDNLHAGDETYIKITGKRAFVFFIISSKNRKIIAYHVDKTRDTLPAIISIKEAIRTSKPNQKITLITDGNPSYQSAVHFINQLHYPKLTLKKVTGLQNLNSESEEFRPYKQLIERLNRTYKSHIKSSCGFNSKNGAIALTVLFVTYYNFIRPHHALKYKTPVLINDLEALPTIQNKWAKILQMSQELKTA